MHIVSVWLIYTFFFCRIAVCTVRKSYAYFIVLSSRLSVTLFALLFLTKQNRHGRQIVSFHFFLFLSGRAKCLSPEQCVVSPVQVQLPCAPFAACRLSRTVAMKLDDHDSRTQCCSLVTALFTVYTQWTPVHLTWGLLRVRAAFPTPRLNLRFELRPSWNNIHDTFPTGATQDTTLIVTTLNNQQTISNPKTGIHI
jgi:hypothetical protein